MPGRIENENICTINMDVLQDGPTISDHHLENALDDDVLLAVEVSKLDTSFEFLFDVFHDLSEKKIRQPSWDTSIIHNNLMWVRSST